MRKLWIFGWMLMLSVTVYGQTADKEVAICYGNTLQLKAESSGATSYEWYHDNQLISGETSDVLVVSEAGSYRAVAVTADACKSDASVSVLLKYRAPVITSEFIAGNGRSEVMINFVQNDEQACGALDPASVQIITQPAHGRLVISALGIRYIPDAGFYGVDSFSYTIKDVNGVESNIATMQIDMTPPLPVKLIAFTARKEQSVAILDWSTATEEESSYFEIQRSTDGKNWQRIGQVAAVGNSLEKTSYQYPDDLPESGINYYRLKMVDKDESFSYSRIVSVHFPEFAWANVFPNPVNNILQVVVRNSRVKHLKLINSSGQTLLHMPVVKKEIQIDMKKHGQGIYLIHLEQDNGKTSVFKIIRD